MGLILGWLRPLDQDKQHFFSIKLKIISYQSVLNKGFFKYRIREFLIHDLTPDLTTETQLLAARGCGTDLNFLCMRDQFGIIFDRNFVICVFERVCDAQVEWENVLILCVAHPLKI